MKNWQGKLIESAALVYFTAATVLLALTLTLTYRGEQGIQTLLTNGKTSSAISARQSAAAAAKGERIIAHVETQLDLILSRSDSNRQLICSIAKSVHVTSPTIVADCAGS